MKKIFFTSIILLNFFSISVAQNIITFAGNGISGTSGVGGPATSAELDGIAGIGIDTAGNVYSANGGSNTILKVNNLGILTLVAGNGTAGFSGDGGPATAAELNNPLEAHCDKAGNIYISDRKNNRIRKVNTSGVISTVVGNGTPGWSGDGGAATSAEINQPIMIAIDNAGNLYIADYMNSCIRKVNTSGIISTIAGIAGIQGYSGDGGLATNAELNYANGIAVDSKGNIYIGDTYNYRIRKINTSGIITTIAGNGTAGYTGDGGAATSAEIDWGLRVCVDTAGDVYFGQWNTSAIRKVNASGIISTVAGNGVSGFSGDGGLATSAEINNPGGVAVSASGNIFIIDCNNNRIREVVNNTAGIEQINSVNGIAIFPNPANETLFIKLDIGFTPNAITINDVTGRRVYYQKISGIQASLQIDISSFSKGMYFVEMENEGKRCVNKFIKE